MAIEQWKYDGLALDGTTEVEPDETTDSLLPPGGRWSKATAGGPTTTVADDPSANNNKTLQITDGSHAATCAFTRETVHLPGTAPGNTAKLTARLKVDTPSGAPEFQGGTLGVFMEIDDGTSRLYMCLLNPDFASGADPEVGIAGAGALNSHGTYTTDIHYWDDGAYHTYELTRNADGSATLDVDSGSVVINVPAGSLQPTSGTKRFGFGCAPDGISTAYWDEVTFESDGTPVNDTWLRETNADTGDGTVPGDPNPFDIIVHDLGSGASPAAPPADPAAEYPLAGDQYGVATLETNASGGTLADNTVFVRVRNRGSDTMADVRVRLYLVPDADLGDPASWAGNGYELTAPGGVPLAHPGASLNAGALGFTAATSFANSDSVGTTLNLVAVVCDPAELSDPRPADLFRDGITFADLLLSNNVCRKTVTVQDAFGLPTLTVSTNLDPLPATTTQGDITVTATSALPPNHRLEASADGTNWVQAANGPDYDQVTVTLAYGAQDIFARTMDMGTSTPTSPITVGPVTRELDPAQLSTDLDPLPTTTTQGDITVTFGGSFPANVKLEVSVDGSSWTTAANGPDYDQVTVPLEYGAQDVLARTYEDGSGITSPGVIIGPATRQLDLADLSTDVDPLPATTDQDTVTVTYSGSAFSSGVKLEVSTDGSTWIRATNGPGYDEVSAPLAYGTQTLQARTFNENAGDFSPPRTLGTVHRELDLSLLSTDLDPLPATTAQDTVTVTFTGGAMPAGFRLEVSTDSTTWIQASNGPDYNQVIAPLAYGSQLVQARTWDTGSSTYSNPVTVGTVHRELDLADLSTNPGPLPQTTTGGSITVTYSGTAFATDVKLEVSLDGSTWTRATNGPGYDQVTMTLIHGAQVVQARTFDEAAGTPSPAVTLGTITRQLDLSDLTTNPGPLPVTTIADTITVDYSGTAFAADIKLEVSLDGSSWTRATNGPGYDQVSMTLSFGTQTVQARTFNEAAGDFSPPVTLGTITRQLDAAQLSTNPGPLPLTTDATTIDVIYSAALPAGVTFQASLDGISWTSAAAGPPYTVALGLAFGPQTVYARTIDLAMIASPTINLGVVTARPWDPIVTYVQNNVFDDSIDFTVTNPQTDTEVEYSIDNGGSWQTLPATYIFPAPGTLDFYFRSRTTVAPLVYSNEVGPTTISYVQAGPNQPDFWIRDNFSDPGDGTGSGTMWRSPDIIVYDLGNTASPSPAPWPDSAAATAANPNPNAANTYNKFEVGNVNYLYVRVWNRGNVDWLAKVRLYVCTSSTLSSITSWLMLNPGDLAETIPANSSMVVGPFTVRPEDLWGGNVNDALNFSGHYCCFGVAYTDDPLLDPIPSELVTPPPSLNVGQWVKNDNSVAWKNLNQIDVLTNASSRTIRSGIADGGTGSVNRVELLAEGLPAGATVTLTLPEAHLTSAGEQLELENLRKATLTPKKLWPQAFVPEYGKAPRATGLAAAARKLRGLKLLQPQENITGRLLRGVVDGIPLAPGEELEVLIQVNIPKGLPTTPCNKFLVSLVQYMNGQFAGRDNYDVFPTDWDQVDFLASKSKHLVHERACPLAERIPIRDREAFRTLGDARRAGYDRAACCLGEKTLPGELSPNLLEHLLNLVNGARAAKSIADVLRIGGAPRGRGAGSTRDLALALMRRRKRRGPFGSAEALLEAPGFDEDGFACLAAGMKRLRSGERRVPTGFHKTRQAGVRATGKARDAAARKADRALKRAANKRNKDNAGRFERLNRAMIAKVRKEAQAARVKAQDGPNVLAGRVVDRRRGTPLVGFSVEAYDRGWHDNDLLGGCATDEKGNFEIRYSQQDFRRGALDGRVRPDIALRVLAPNGEVVHEAPEAEGHAAPRVRLTLKVDAGRSARKGYRIEGRVRPQGRGRSAAGLQVAAHGWSLLDDDAPLGAAWTDRQGRFVMVIAEEEAERGLFGAFEDAPDLFIEVADRRGRMLGGSEVWKSAGPVQRVEVYI